jgi:outer membrane receptor for ferrienterochelin and colicin
MICSKWGQGIMIRLIRARRWALSSALMLVALVVTMPVRANDPPALEDLLEMTVSSAARRSQSPAEAPSMVSVITAAEIRNFGWHKLGEGAVFP